MLHHLLHITSHHTNARLVSGHVPAAAPGSRDPSPVSVSIRCQLTALVYIYVRVQLFPPECLRQYGR